MSQTYTQNEYASIFGEKGWPFVRNAIAKGLRKRFHPRTQELDDAVSHVLCGLIDQWVTFPTSVTDDVGRNIAYACYWGISEGSRYLSSVYAENETLYALVDEDHQYDSTIGPDAVEARALRRDPPEYDPLLAELSQLSDEELRAWWARLPERPVNGTRGNDYKGL